MPGDPLFDHDGRTSPLPDAASASPMLARLLERIGRLRDADFARVPLEAVAAPAETEHLALSAWERALTPATRHILEGAFVLAFNAALAQYTTVCGDGSFGRGYHYARALAFGCVVAVAAEAHQAAPPLLDEHFRTLVRPILTTRQENP